MKRNKHEMEYINKNEIIKETNKEYNPNKPEIQKEQI